MKYSKCSQRIKLTMENLKIIWDDILLKTPVMTDYKSIYHWIRDICDTIIRTKEDSTAFISLANLEKFYFEKLVQKPQDPELFKFLNEEGFYCY